MKIKQYCYLLIATNLLFQSLFAYSNANDEPLNLSLMSNMIGGKWWLGTDNYKTFEWGLGRTQIKMKHVMIEENKEYMVAEGFFYYSPNSFSIKGVSTFQYKNQQPRLLEYFGNVEEGSLDFVYKSILPSGETKIYTEKWQWVDDNQYRWTLASLEDDADAKKGIYIRKYN